MECCGYGIQKQPCIRAKANLRVVELFKIVKIYVDDVVIFNQILNKQVEHFSQIFGFSNKMNCDGLNPYGSLVVHGTYMVVSSMGASSTLAEAN